MFPSYSIKDFIITPNQEWQFYVGKFENVQEPPNMLSPHKHDFYEILWIRKGKTLHTIDYHEIQIEPDTLFFMSPGQVHLIDNSQSVEADCLLFTEDFFHLNFPNKEPALIPLQRFGQPDEVSAVVLLLAANGYINGQTINVNGGWYMS